MVVESAVGGESRSGLIRIGVGAPVQSGARAPAITSDALRSQTATLATPPTLATLVTLAAAQVVRWPERQLALLGASSASNTLSAPDIG